ncbi:hypothetical protein SAMN05444157_1660 [Frankineae bacterium MT45]|nr:hypothetical protein SAMN05444157_1660 [Frankineae bacterium MT45]
MSVAVAFIRVWMMIAVGVGVLVLVLVTVAPKRYERLAAAATVDADGVLRRWTYPVFAVGVAVPATLVLPVAWQLNPTDDRTGLPLRQDGYFIVFSFLATAFGVGGLACLPFLYRHQRRATRLTALLAASARAHASDSEHGVSQLIPLLVLLTDHRWPMSVGHLDSKIRAKADDELRRGDDVGPWWPRDRDDLAADLAVLVDIGLVEETAGAYAGSPNWRITKAGRQYLNHSARLLPRAAR